MANQITVNTADGALLKGLKVELNNAILKLKGGWKQSNFSKCFPSLATHQEASLEKIRTVALKPLIGAIINDVSLIIEEIEDPLNKLSLLIKNNTNPKDAVVWRPTGIPEQDIIAHDVKVLKSQKRILEEALTSHRNKRMELFERVKSGRAQCAQNQEKIANFANILDETINTCSSLPIESIGCHMEEDLQLHED